MTHLLGRAAILYSAVLSTLSGRLLSVFRQWLRGKAEAAVRWSWSRNIYWLSLISAVVAAIIVTDVVAVIDVVIIISYRLDWLAICDFDFMLPVAVHMALV